MNRRTSIKQLTFFGILGLSSFSVYGWLRNKPRIALEEITNHTALIAELAETIIPRTDTPGAKDAKVEEFIILIVSECDTKKVQNNFLIGLSDLIEYTREKHHCEFIHCSIQAKISILNHFESLTSGSNGFITKVKHKLLGVPFFTHLHALTVEGFCTSQAGATQVLAYDYLPGGYQGCLALKPHQKSWAT